MVPSQGGEGAGELRLAKGVGGSRKEICGAEERKKTASESGSGCLDGQKDGNESDYENENETEAVLQAAAGATIFASAARRAAAKISGVVAVRRASRLAGSLKILQRMETT